MRILAAVTLVLLRSGGAWPPTALTASSAMAGQQRRNIRASTKADGTGVQKMQEIRPMARDFEVGDHVEWNSEAGCVRGTIQKKITAEITFKGYTVHASKEEPQYLIKSDKTDHLAMHKGSALKKV